MPYGAEMTDLAMRERKAALHKKITCNNQKYFGKVDVNKGETADFDFSQYPKANANQKYVWLKCVPYDQEPEGLDGGTGGTIKVEI